MYICSVIVDIPYMQDGWSYTHTESLEIGQLVSVPIGNGNRICAGLVLECTEFDNKLADNLENNLNSVDYKYNPDNLKSIIEVSHIILPKTWLDMVYFIAKYYHEGIGEVALSLIPNYLKNYRFWHKQTLSKAYDKFVNKFLKQDSTNNPQTQNLITLNDEQNSVFSAIIKDKFNYNVHVLHGITGSGKTQVYIHLIHNYLLNSPQSQILVLIPEINLTPQIVGIIQKQFFHIPVVVLNSDLSDKQRSLNWYLAYTGFAKIIIGTRSASTAVLPHLSLIIIDEEHDLSYKQQSGIRYSARDSLIWRAKYLNIPIVLGSATPSLETYHHALNINGMHSNYHYHVLNKRATNANLPNVHIIDMQNYLQKQLQGDVLSPPLVKAMHKTLENKQQVLLFLNRRGFAPVMFCPNCRFTFSCKNCSVNLVFHKKTNSLNCHHCGYYAKITHKTFQNCPSCSHTQILPVGVGTQRLVEVLNDKFANYKSIRIDSDSTSKKGELEHQLEMINNKEVDIIIGTQMLAKGHDFKRVGLVGVIQPDGMLYSYNFRSTEHLFCQLMQVTGRAGRHNQSSDVFIQTMFHQHPLFKAIKQHNYNQYADALLKERQDLELMPYAFEVHIYASHATPDKAKQELQALYDCVIKKSVEFNCLVTPPAHHTMLKQNGEERAYIVIENKVRAKLHSFIDEIMPYIKSMRCSWYIEIL
jgi:primosomal protein N' (replication factor Y)